MTDRTRAPRIRQGLMVLGSSLALVLAAVGATVAHPASAVHVANSVNGGSLRNLITARILLIEPGITQDDLDEVVDQLVDEVENGDAETPEVEAPEVDVPEVETPEVEQPDANEVDEQEADNDQGEDDDDQGEEADHDGDSHDGDQSESDDGGEGDGGD
jgi:hypothetical protein